MQKRQINFTTNWNNKLYCDHYTTIRLASPYYQVGRFYDIELRKECLHTARIIDIRFLKLENINTFISYIDAGLSVEDFKTLMNRFYKDKDWSTQRLIMILLEKVERIKEDQEPNNSEVEKTLNFRKASKEMNYNENTTREVTEANNLTGGDLVELQKEQLQQEQQNNSSTLT